MLNQSAIDDPNVLVCDGSVLDILKLGYKGDGCAVIESLLLQHND